MTKLMKPSLAPRNPVARSPLLRKGGRHQSEKAKTRLTPATLKAGWTEDWREELEFERSLKHERPQNRARTIR